MNRVITATWGARIQRHLPERHCSKALEGALETVAQRLHIDPVVLLGTLAEEEKSSALWTELQRALREDDRSRAEDWTELDATARHVMRALGKRRALHCWIVEPSDPAEAFAVASCLALRASGTRVSVVATHSDPIVAEVGRSGLVSETFVGLAPFANRETHFRDLGRCWQVRAPLRSAVRFETVDVLHDREEDLRAFVTNADLIVSRGLLSRVAATEASRLAVRLQRILRTSGFLLVGSGEHDALLFDALERRIAPGVLLYQKQRTARRRRGSDDAGAGFAKLVAAVEADPSAWEPRWDLASLLLREGHAEPALSHLREVVRQQPNKLAAWEDMAQAYTLLGDASAAAAARRRAVDVSPAVAAAA